MAQIITIQNREGDTCYPITSTKAVIGENGVDLDTMLAQQKQNGENALKEYPKKTEVVQDLAGKQNALSTTTDLHITADNIIGLTEKAKKRLFCDMFNAAVGNYGYARITDGVFDCKLNELTLTYEEAIDTMSEPRIRGDYTTSNSNQFLYSHATFRTHLPKTAPERISRCQYTFIEAQKLEVVNARIIPLDLCFTGCKNLKKINIYQLIGSASSEAQRAYDNCKALSDIYVEMMGKYDVNLKWSPLITKESFQRIIAATPSNVTNAGGYTITVHANVYAKLTGDTTNAAAAALTADELAQWQKVLTDAQAKNISFATV